jgi:KipI family sensor histidine kinase inhibitor
MRILPASDSSLLVSFGDALSPEAHQQVMQLAQALAQRPAGIRNLHPAFASALIDFDPRRCTHEDVEKLVQSRMAAHPEIAAAGRLVEIPVRYGGADGPDLEEVARHTGLPPRRVVELHAAAEYPVYFVGFAPGFPYLGGMPPELATPRLATPRKRVPAGSLAIGGAQTGIYPLESPGGWRLIGRTSLPLFDPAADPPALLRMGDRVRFVPLEELPR